MIITILGFLISCKKQTESSPGTTGTSGTINCSGPAKSFSNDVSPIFQASCASSGGCHGNGSFNGPGELTNYSKIFNARSSIRSAVASGDMPRIGSLTPAEKNAILCWIDNGAPNN